VSRGAAAAALVAVGIVVGGLLGALGRASPSPTAAAPETAAPTERGEIEVHVAGWVTAPGVVRVPDGAIVADAVEAAGGLRNGASADGINLAAPLSSGDQVVVPGPDEAGSAVAADDGLISLNRADAAALEGLPGVGPVLAERIVAHRDQNGPFGQVEDLLQVPGIGEAKLASIRDLVRVP